MIQPHTRRPRAPTLAAMILLLPALDVQAVDPLDAPAAPNDAGSAMYDLSNLYNRLDSGAVGAKRGGTFAEPASGPGDTMYSLDAIMDEMPAVDDTDGAAVGDVVTGKTFWGLRSGGGWGLLTGTNAGGGASQALVPKTGQTTCHESNGNPIPCTNTRQDGDLQKGLAWPNPRFTINVNDSDDDGTGGGTANNGICDGGETCNGTVTDNLTGLIWLTKANCIGTDNASFDNDGTNGDGRVTWQHALDFVAGVNDGSYDCGDTSNSSSHQTDWRLPNRNELNSLVDIRWVDPALSDTAGTWPWTTEGSPFSGVRSSYYWSSSTYANNLDRAWFLELFDGTLDHTVKSSTNYVWPVRGGQ